MDSFMKVFSRNVFNFYDVLVLIFAFNFCRTSGAIFKVLGIAIVGSIILHFYDYSRGKKRASLAGGAI